MNMKIAKKIILTLWIIANLVWIWAFIGNVRASGWDIIGIWDIWPMVLCAVAMVFIIRTNVKARDNEPTPRDDEPGVEEEAEKEAALDESNE